MLAGGAVGLRARVEADVAVLHAELYDDVPTRIRGDSRPWTPLAAESPRSPYAVADGDDSVAFFSIVELPSGELAGEALLYSIDPHNRSAHAGLALRPSCRGKRLSAPVLELLCHYGFEIRGLHRLQLETLSDNEPMIRAARRTGFVEEGRLRDARWVDGRFADELVFGRLRQST
ncbi:MAG TPA: GNAT family protein [Gaiellaceae bacterium]|jgi:RimJ/RimL family protein N-acetyltransferase|nr:GNAT family protein [Gaiellaceae bacterium]